ncbi:unnamed protein product [Adineta ricciae]|uniref:Uncharacterized protein n=1 Tax=Adineta ricciae TaxID=249248 RepID=A0A816D496_ADIRI|nr:unnamed protein product [Adineta ricciae]
MIAVCDIDFSDDELEYLSYFNMVYAFYRIKSSKTPSERAMKLIEHFKEYILIGIELSHKYKRMDKSPFYNWIYCYVLNQLNSSNSDCDSLISDGVWYLQRLPLELVNWQQYNSMRMDIEINQLAACFSDQLYSRQILPPDERIVHLWNGSPFHLDSGNPFYEEDPTIFLISYWGMRFYNFLEN